MDYEDRIKLADSGCKCSLSLPVSIHLPFGLSAVTVGAFLMSSSNTTILGKPLTSVQNVFAMASLRLIKSLIYYHLAYRPHLLVFVKVLDSLGLRSVCRVTFSHLLADTIVPCHQFFCGFFFAPSVAFVINHLFHLFGHVSSPTPYTFFPHLHLLYLR